MKLYEGLNFSVPYMGYFFSVSILRLTEAEIKYNCHGLGRAGADITVRRSGNEYQQWSNFMASLIKFISREVAER